MHSTTKRSWLRTGLIFAAILALAGGACAFYLFNLPHRAVMATKADATIEAQALVDEFLKGGPAADAKYLDTDGDSKVLAVSGTVSSNKTDLNGQTVMLLMWSEAKAGVRYSFAAESNAQTVGLMVGDSAAIEGVDHGITFVKGNPSTNIARSVDVTVKPECTHEQ